MLLAGGAAATPDETVVVISPSKRSSFYTENMNLQWFGEWTINDQWLMRGGYKCQHTKSSFLGWPSDASCTGELSVRSYTNSYSLAEQSRAKLREMESSPTISVSGEKTWDKFFDLLLQQDEALLSWNGVLANIKDFKLLANAAYAKNLEAENATIRQRRSDILIEVFLNIAILSALVGALVFTFRYLRKKLPAVAKGIQDVQVRRVVADETIRETTRAAMNTLNDADKAALRTQIKEAIDSGNTELAKTLMSLLQKLEGDG